MELRYRREAMVGVFIIVAAAIFVLGVIWLRGKSLRSGELVEIVFSDVSGLKVGDPVRTSGVTVGQVKDIQLVTPGKVHVYLNLTTAKAPRCRDRSPRSAPRRSRAPAPRRATWTTIPASRRSRSRPPTRSPARASRT